MDWATARTVSTMSEHIAWLAGLLEGEGCFSTQRGRLSYPRVALGMTDLDIVERAASIFPGHGSIRPRGTSATGSKQMFQVQWSGEVAMDLMRTVLPYMGTRRSDRIMLIITNRLELQMTTCVVCRKEFSRGWARTDLKVCGDICWESRAKANRKSRMMAP